MALKWFSVMCVLVHLCCVYGENDQEIRNVTAVGEFTKEAVVTCVAFPKNTIVRWLFNRTNVTASERITFNHTIKKDGKDIPNRNDIEVIEFTLKIKSPTEVDAGAYTCTIPGDSRTAILNLNFNGSLVKSTKGPLSFNVTDSGVNKIMELQCVFEVYNQSQVQWILHRDGLEDDTLNGSVTVRDPNNPKIITSTYVATIDSKNEDIDMQNGTYECRVWDQYGSNKNLSGKTDVLIYDTPSVEIGRAKAISSTEIYFDWIVKAHNAKIQNYYLYIANHTDNYLTYTSYSRQINASANYYIIENLKPASTYKLRFQVSTYAPSKDAYLPNGTVSTLAEDPVFVPNISINGFTARSMTIGLSAPPPEIADYVHYYELEERNKNDSNSMKYADHVRDHRNLPYMFNNLDPHTTYVFKARACFEYGTKRCGNWSEEMEAVTADRTRATRLRPDSPPRPRWHKVSNVPRLPDLEPNTRFTATARQPAQAEVAEGEQPANFKTVDSNKKEQLEILNQTTVSNGTPLRLPFQGNATTTTSTSTTAPDYPYRNRGPYKAFGFGIHCAPGYYLSRITEKCEDINECESGEADCGPNGHCINSVGGYTCNLGNSCPIGLRMTADHECVDVDECELAGHQLLCTRNADCVNTLGSFRCRCHTGFRTAPANEKVCVDVDECSESDLLCEHRCNNLWGGYKCSCRTGYRLNNDNRTCADVDECAEYKSKGLCMWQCINEPGSYHCRCPSGYRLSEDMRSCIDIDECETREAFCVSSKGIYGYETDVCMNTRGSYRCHHISCPIGYKLDNTTINKNRCSKIERLCPPTDGECAHQPTTISYSFITFVSQLYLPNGKVDMFTMRGPAWEDSRLIFELRMVDVNTPPSIRDRAQIDAFLLTQTNQTALVSLVKPIQGPQTLELELSMELYSGESFAGVAVAKLFIIVSEYEF